LQEFHCKAYKATERKELISLLNEFLDSSIVLPPCDWEREELLSLRELKEKSEQIKRRKTRAASQKGIILLVNSCLAIIDIDHCRLIY